VPAGSSVGGTRWGWKGKKCGELRGKEWVAVDVDAERLWDRAQVMDLSRARVSAWVRAGLGWSFRRAGKWAPVVRACEKILSQSLSARSELIGRRPRDVDWCSSKVVENHIWIFEKQCHNLWLATKRDRMWSDFHKAEKFQSHDRASLRRLLISGFWCYLLQKSKSQRRRCFTLFVL